MGSVQMMRNDPGFTLVEVLIAVSILTIGLLATATMQASAIRGNSFASSVSNGTTWASDKIEKLIDLSYDDYFHSDLDDTDGDGDGGLDDATAATADHQETQGDYTIFWNVSEDSLLNNTKTISVIVTWMDHETQKRVSMRHIVPRVI